MSRDTEIILDALNLAADTRLQEVASTVNRFRKVARNADWLTIEDRRMLIEETTNTLNRANEILNVADRVGNTR